jgi:hypothetical protein
MTVPSRWLTAILFFQGLLLCAQRVETRNGDVYYTDAHGKSRQITSGGIDYDPSLSFDGRTVIFVRRTLIPARFEEPANDQPTKTQIWVATIDGSRQPEMIFAGPVTLKDYSEYVTFHVPKLAPDNRHAFFSIDLAVTEGGLVRLDLKTKDTALISPALGFDFIAAGRYAGDLVVQMRTSVRDGLSPFFWLLTPDGKDLGFVGQSEEEAQEFLRDPNRKLRKYPFAAAPLTR